MNIGVMNLGEFDIGNSTHYRVAVHVQAVHGREGELQDELHGCHASLAQTKREKEELGISLQERSLQLAGLQREAADKKRALDSECEKLSRERHKRQRIEEDNKVRVAEQHTADIAQAL